MADDSGLEVEALDGAPGVYSARYAGESCDYATNNAKLLRELDGKENRHARFRTVMALARPGEEPLTVDGVCEGTILSELRGEHGFGYDPLFVWARFPMSGNIFSKPWKNNPPLFQTLEECSINPFLMLALRRTNQRE